MKFRYFKLKKKLRIRSDLANLPQQCEYKQLLWVEWKIGYEIGGEHRCHCFRFLEPHGQQTKHSCSAYGGKETSPIITHGKIGCGYFNAEQDTTNWSGKTWSNSNGTSGGQHFRMTRFIFINALERCHHFTQQLSNNTGNMHERTLHNGKIIKLI